MFISCDWFHEIFSMSSVMAQLAATTFQQLGGNRATFLRRWTSVWKAKCHKRPRTASIFFAPRWKNPTKLQDSLRVHLFHWVWSSVLMQFSRFSSLFFCRNPPILPWITIISALKPGPPKRNSGTPVISCQVLCAALALGRPLALVKTGWQNWRPRFSRSRFRPWLTSPTTRTWHFKRPLLSMSPMKTARNSAVQMGSQSPLYCSCCGR